MDQQSVSLYKYGRGPTDSPTPRKLPLAKQAEIGKMLDDIQHRGVNEELDSPWSSHVILAWKRNGDLRFCVDYRKLSDVTKKEEGLFTTALD
jgi:hypothetical protein